MNVQVGDKITLVGRSTHQQMRQRSMTVGGIFDIGVPTIEKETVYISLAEAQSLYDLPNQSTEIVITLKQLGQEPAVMAALTPPCMVMRLNHGHKVFRTCNKQSAPRMV